MHSHMVANNRIGPGSSATDTSKDSIADTIASDWDLWISGKEK